MADNMAFCEIKISPFQRTVCTGNISRTEDNTVTIPNMIFFSGEKEFDGVITFLDKSRGIQVFKAHILIDADKKNVTFTNSVRITNTERRADFRAVVDLPALANIPSEPKVSYDAIIKDMSVRGISLWVRKSLKLDDEVGLQFLLYPGGTVYTCSCNIVRFISNSEYNFSKYGCEFMNLSSESLTAIRAFMTRKRTEMLQNTLF